MGNIIALVVTILIAVGAIVYIVRTKKSGKTCIGCPDGCCPSSKNREGSACSCYCGCGGEDKNR